MADERQDGFSSFVLRMEFDPEEVVPTFLLHAALEKLACMPDSPEGQGEQEWMLEEILANFFPGEGS